jgi:hypothetical protein
MRLFDQARRRAAREQMAAQITSRIRQSLEVERVLQTAARELGDALDFAQVNIRLAVGTSGGTGAEPAARRESDVRE